MKKLLALFILLPCLAFGATTDLKTGSELTFHVPMFNPAGTGEAAYGRYSLLDISAALAGVFPKYMVDQGGGYAAHAGTIYIGPTEPQSLGQYDLWLDSDSLAYEPPTVYQKCFVIKKPESTDDIPVEKFPFDISVSKVWIYTNGGNSVTGMLDKCTAASGLCTSTTALKTDQTVNNGAQTEVTGLTTTAVSSGQWVRWHTTSVDGSVNFVSVCFEYSR